MNAFPCRICSESYASREERAACEERNIADRSWLTA